MRSVCEVSSLQTQSREASVDADEINCSQRLRRSKAVNTFLEASFSYTFSTVLINFSTLNGQKGKIT